MQGCFSSLLALAGFVLLMVTLIRWFEQMADAVDAGWWNKVALLILMPFAVWLFPSKVGVGRATAVPRHEPVRGFGSIGKPHVLPPPDAPPPGTPKEFLELPKIPPPKPRTKSAVDPEKIAKLKQKMREQGMLPPDEG